MYLLDLMAKLSLNTDEYDKGLKNAEGGMETSGSAITAKAVALGNLAADAIKTGATAVLDFAKSSIQAGSDFDSAMSQVAATAGMSMDELNSNVVTVGDFTGTLRDFAQQEGATTAFSATQAAEALNYMALAGYDATTSVQMLPNVLNLAAAGSMDLAAASDMVTDAQTALGLSLDETNVMVDQMAMISSKTNTSVSQVGEAFLTVGANAKTMSGGTKEMAQVLGILADNSIKGSEGGTHLRNILLALNPTTEDAAKAWKQLGISAYDSEGNLRPLQDTFEDLNSAMDGMTQQERTDIISKMFNKTDLASVNALLATSTDRWNQVADEIDNAAGSAEKMANTQLDNLAGDTTMFQSALEGAQIAISDRLTPALRSFTQLGASALQGFTNGLKEGGLTGAIEGLASGIMEKLPELVGKIREFAVKAVTALGEVFIAEAPKVASYAGDMLNSLGEGITANLPTILEKGSEILQGILDGITEGLPGILESGVEIVSNIANGIMQNLPAIYTAIYTTMAQLLGFILDNLPAILEAGITLIQNLANGIIQNFPALVSSMTKGMAKLINVIIDHLPQIIAKGIEIVAKLVVGLIQAIPKIVAAIPKLIKAIKDGFSEVNWGEVGINVIKGIAEGIKSAIGIIKDAAVNAANSAFEAAKDFLGIHSPSTLMRDKIGRFMALGMAEGISDYSGAAVESMRDASRAVSDAATLSMSSDFSGSGTDTRAAAYAPVTINVYGAEGQSVTDLAEKISDIINANIYRQKAVFA